MSNCHALMHMNLSLVLCFSLYFLVGYIAVFLSCILWCVLFVFDVDTISSIRGVAEIHLNLNLNLNHPSRKILATSMSIY